MREKWDNREEDYARATILKAANQCSTIFKNKNSNAISVETIAAGIPPNADSLKLSLQELNTASLHPLCIVANYLYADVAALVAPGGTGKTTLQIYEAICIAIGFPLYGNTIKKTGWILFITAEDRREYLAARLRQIMQAMNLSDDQRQQVLNTIRIWDVTGETVKLVSNIGGSIVPSRLADDIIAAYSNHPPIMVVFDPLVSFGASEQAVNDNEQAIITAARRIVRAFNCCVRLIAHTGKANAAEKNLTQYAGRGGSALADGARMVTVMQPWAEDCGISLPAGCIESPGSNIIVLARPKLSYAPPQPLLLIQRSGFSFSYFVDIPVTQEEKRNALLKDVENLLVAELNAGRKHSFTSLEAAIPNSMTRADYRRAIKLLMASGRVIESDLPPNEIRTRRKTFLQVNPAVTGAEVSKFPSTGKNTVTPVNNAAAYRENNGGIISAADYSPFSNNAAPLRRD